MGKPRYKLTSVAIDPDIKEQVLIIAKRQGRQFNKIVDEALQMWIDIKANEHY